MIKSSGLPTVFLHREEPGYEAIYIYLCKNLEGNLKEGNSLVPKLLLGGGEPRYEARGEGVWSKG